MDWKDHLIATYITICDLWKKGVNDLVRRHSNYNNFALTDEEIVTLYLFGIISGYTSIRSIYDYSVRHLRDWFPTLGGYEAFNCSGAAVVMSNSRQQFPRKNNLLI